MQEYIEYQIKAQKNKDLRVVHFSLDLCKELSTLVVKIGPVRKFKITTQKVAEDSHFNNI